MNRDRRFYFGFVVVLIVIFSWEISAVESRNFLMGFNPWAWDATPEAIDWTYSQLGKDGDIIAHHIEQGIPWNEALKGEEFSKDFKKILSDLKAKTPKGLKVLLEVSPLNGARSGLGDYRNERMNAPLPKPWDTYSFNDPSVKKAYLNFVKRMADLLEPDFLQTGIEVNQLRSKRDANIWNQYKDLQCFIYKELKSAGYKQPISVSIISQAYYHPDLYAPEHHIKDQLQVLKDLEPCVDMIHWSVHPFVSGLLAEKFPTDYFSTLFSLTKKPQAISESSYPAQVWSMPNGSPTWNGSQEKQANFVKQLLEAAQTQELKFVIWFTPRDFDQLWARPYAEGGLNKDALGLVWRDTGLFDEKGDARPAHATWRQWLSKSRAEFQKK